MLRAAALICILSTCILHTAFCLCDEVLVTIDIESVHGKVFGPTTSDTTSSNVPITSDATIANQCTNLRCTEQQCSNNKPDPSKIISLRNLVQNSQCSCLCCGYRKRFEPTLRILGDKRTRSISNEFPWIVAILKEEEEHGIRSYDYKCVGSLIHPSVVLTAAHCISKIDSSKLMIRVGVHSILVENNNVQNMQVAEYIIHEHNSDYGYDIALMFLKNPVNINANVGTICLPPHNANFDLQRCLVSGWGKNATDGKFQTTLKTVQLPIVPRDKCIRSLRTTELGRDYELSDSIICAGGEANEDTCEGDGGAPLVCKIPDTRNQYHQVGIVSWGVGCGGSIPAAYVNVALFRNWIDEKLRNKNLS